MCISVEVKCVHICLCLCLSSVTMSVSVDVVSTSMQYQCLHISKPGSLNQMRVVHSCNYTRTQHMQAHPHAHDHTPNTLTITHQPAQVGDVLHEIDGHVVYRHPVHQLAPLILGQVCSRGLGKTGQSEQRGVRTKCV